MSSLEDAYRFFLETFPENTGQGLQRKIIEYLEQAEGEIPVNDTTTAGETGFFMALYEGMEEVAVWFLNHGGDPWKVPNLEAARLRAGPLSMPTRRERVYVSSSPIHYAFKTQMSLDFLQKLLSWDGEKSKSHIQNYTNEYVFGSLLDVLYFRGWYWFHLSIQELFERMRLLIEWGSPVSREVYRAFTKEYYNETQIGIIAGRDIGWMAYHYMKKDLSAVRIQRIWRQRRLMRTVCAIQEKVRARIWNPEHKWKDGNTTVQRIFAGKSY